MMSDRIFAGIWLLLCIAGLFVAWQITSEYSYEPVGPRPFPLGIISLMLVCAVALLLRHPDTISWPRRHVLQAADDGDCSVDVRLGFRMARFSHLHRHSHRGDWHAVPAQRFRLRVFPRWQLAFCCGMPLTDCLTSPYHSAPGWVNGETMDTWIYLSQGFAVAMTPENLVIALIGCFVGTIVGLLPGLGPINGVASPLPLALLRICQQNLR